jgi:hypothetical protein
MKKKGKLITQIDEGDIEKELLKALDKFFKDETSAALVCEKTICPDCKESTVFAKISRQLYLCPCEKYFDARINGDILFKKSKLTEEELEAKLEEFKKGSSLH